MVSVPIKLDTLLAAHDWPGCTLGYEILGGGADAPALRLTVRFDRAAVPAGGEMGLIAWLSIRRHANDPSLEVTVSCSLQGERAVGDPAAAVGQYRALVEKLCRGVAQGGDVPVTAAMTLPLAPALIAERADMLFPLTAGLTVARRGQTVGGGDPPPCERVHSPLAPWLPSAAARPCALAAWAQAAEEALAGHDGAGGTIRLAQRASRDERSADLWALRWGGTSGIALARREEPAVAFAARPFAADLLTGTATITVWNDALVPDTSGRSFDGIDADAAFGRVLAILDGLSAPGSAAALGRADPAVPCRIEAARRAAARALAGQLVPVLAAHEGLGMPAQARHRMEQAVIAGKADAAGTWVQVPLVAPAARLRLGGVLSGVPLRPDMQPLPADILLDADACWLGFPVPSSCGDDRAMLSLRPGWTLTDIERLDDADRAQPAGRLALLLPHPQDAAPDLLLGEVEVPLTARFYPGAAVLLDQEAAAPGDVAGGTLAELMHTATRWSLAVSVGREQPQPQDELWLALAFNRPLVAPLARTKGAGLLPPLAAGLIRFEAGYASLAPLLAGRLAERGPFAGELAGIVAALADDLAHALVAPPASDADAEDRITWVWRHRPNPDGSRTLFVRGDPRGAADGTDFPLVAGCAPQDCRPAPVDRAPDAGRWREAAYRLPEGAGAKSLAFVLGGLELLSRQTAVAGARVTRNPAGSGLNPLLARATGWTPPGPVVVPVIDLSGPLAASAEDGSLEQALAVVLHPFCRAGDRTGGERRLRLEIVCRHPLGAMDDASGPIASVPVLSTSLCPDAGTDPAELAASLGEACRAWGEAFPLPRAGAWLCLSAALTVEREEGTVPLLAVRRLDLPWPPHRQDGRAQDSV